MFQNYLKIAGRNLSRYKGISFINIAWPVAYLVMKSWLQNFAYRINMPYWAFFVAALIALFFAIITVSVQTIYAATRNPVKAISYE
jgi:putative ABC transport system permease protein